MSNGSSCSAIYANATALCLYANTPAVQNCLADDEASGILGDYLIFWRCTADGSLLALLLLVPYMLALLAALGSTADNFLMPQLTFLSKLLRLSPDVAGVTLLAIGNAAPDVFSAIAVATSDLSSSSSKPLDLSFMMSDIIGGTLFIMTVVVGSVVWMAGSRAPGWSIGRLPFWRDLVMLFVAVTFVLLIGRDGYITLLQACCLLALHAVYIASVLLLPRFLGRRAASTSSSSAAAAAAAAAARRGDHETPGSCSTAPPPLSTRLLDGGQHLAPSGDMGTAHALPHTAAPGAPGAPGVHGTLPLASGSAVASSSTVLMADQGGAHSTSVQHAEDGALFKPLAAVACEPMPGLEWPAGSDAGVLAIALHVVELPLSVLRWATIPASDGHWDRKRRQWNCLSAPLGLLLLSTQVYGDIYGAAAARVGSSSVPILPLWLLAGLVVSAGLWVSTCDERPPRWYPLLVACGFVMTVIWLKVLAGEAVALIETIGLLLHISTSILGLTVMAIGNSVGDFVADTAAAREGTVSGARMGLAACFGSPVIMNIVSVGIAFTLRLALTGGRPITYGALSKLTRLGYLLFYWTVFSHVVVFPLGGYRAPRVYALYLLTIYVSLLTLSCLIEIDAIKCDWLCTTFFFMFGDCQP